MAARALVVAIENYPSLTGGSSIARALTGTLQAGLDFKAWLEQKWTAEQRKEGETQLLFCSEPAQPGGTGATRKDILRALLKLKQDGQNATEELYVFFSGHGFSFAQRPGSRADVVLTSDFEAPALSSDCCLNLDEIVAWLRDHLGPGRHYYFVDACRNPIDPSQIQVGALLPIDPNASPEASTFVLQSTIEGTTAAVDSAFPTALMAGLRGKGKAKAWDQSVSDAMFVRYDSLRQFVKSTLANTQPISSRAEGPDGESDALLATLRPIPLSKCTIEVANILPLDTGEISIKRGRAAVDEKHPLNGGPLVLQLEPDVYSIAVRLQGSNVTPAAPIAVDLFDDQKLVFTKARGATRGLASAGVLALPPLATMAAAATVRVNVVVPSGAALSLKNLGTGDEQRFEASTQVRLPGGGYVATAFSDSGQKVVKTQEVELTPGRDATVNLFDWQGSLPHSAIGSKLPEASGLPLFSESLGPVVDTDLNLWLAICGGGRLLGSTGDYSKLSLLPLHDFRNESAGASPLYVLAGFQDPATTLRVGVSQRPQATWGDAHDPVAMPGLKEFYLPLPPGPLLVSFSIAGQPAYTVASHASPNRGTFITLTLDDDGRPNVSQYLLPIGHLVPNLPEDVRVRIQSRNQLSDVRFLAQASRAFRKRRNVAKDMGSKELDALLHAKWLDPVASSLAAYELVRRGSRNTLGEVVHNMQRFFSDLPDTAALARLNGAPVARPNGVPLFLDGVRAFPGFEQWLPLPATHLDFSSPWTAWRAAVTVP